MIEALGNVVYVTWIRSGVLLQALRGPCVPQQEHAIENSYRSADASMPVSYLPCVTFLLLLAIPLLCFARGRRAFFIGTSISVGVVAVLFLWVYIPGWILMSKAHSGDPAAQYELARWTENHCERMGSVILWPCEPDVFGGFAWLEKAAAQDYPPAVYLVGVRLKHGAGVPKPADWNGPGGNHFPQPDRGQKMIDRALELGFRPPPGDEVSYYMRVYRRESPNN